MNKIRDYLNNNPNKYAGWIGGELYEQDGTLTGSFVYLSLKWTGESPFRLTIKREDTTENEYPIFDVGGVPVINELTESTVFMNNSSVVHEDLVGVGEWFFKPTREFSACLNPGVPFPDISIEDQPEIACDGGEDEVAFSLTDLNPEPGPMFTVTLGGQSEGDAVYTGTIQQLYEYLLSQSGIEVVLLSRARDLPDAVDPK